MWERISDINKSLSSRALTPFRGHSDHHWCLLEFCNGVDKWQERQLQAALLHMLLPETGKLHLLMAASHCMHWAGNLHIWQGKLAKNGRKHQQTEANMEREREAHS